MDITMYQRFTNIVMEKGIEEAAKTALHLGFTSVEPVALLGNNPMLPFASVADAREKRRILDDYNLPMVCYSVGVNLWQNPEGERQLMEQADFAAELGSPYLHHCMLPWNQPPATPCYEEAVADVLPRVARVAEYARSIGLQCIYEDQGCYVNGVTGFGTFFNRLLQQCNDVGVCADLGNILFVNEDAEDFLKAFMPYVRHVHVKDYQQVSGAVSPGEHWRQAKNNTWIRPTPVGTGVVDFAACFALLRQAGYTGHISLENNHPEDFEAGVKTAFAYLNDL